MMADFVFDQSEFRRHNRHLAWLSIACFDVRGALRYLRRNKTISAAERRAERIDCVS